MIEAEKIKYEGPIGGNSQGFVPEQQFHAEKFSQFGNDFIIILLYARICERHFSELILPALYAVFLEGKNPDCIRIGSALRFPGISQP